MSYAFLLTIDNGDSRGNVVQTIRGAGSLLDLVEGRDAEVIGSETIYNRYVLKPSLLPGGTPEITCVAWVGINVGVPAVVRNEYSQNTALWRTIEFGGGTFTRAWMQREINNNAIYSGSTHGWQIIPGDVLTGGSLLAHFQPLSIITA